MNPLLAALEQLDPLNDDHWTANGDPRLEALEAILGVKVSRAEVVNAAPDFDRAKAANPETLLMNQEKAPEEAAAVAEPELEDGVAPNETLASYEELLSSKGGTVSGEILQKALVRGEGLADQEILILQKELSASELEVFRLGLLEVVVRHRQVAEKMQEQQKLLRWNEAVIKNYLTVLNPEPSNQDAIKAYIESQNRTRANAAQNRITILRGLDLSGLTGIAPIDSAMAPKNSRGKTRPVYPRS